MFLYSYCVWVKLLSECHSHIISLPYKFCWLSRICSSGLLDLSIFVFKSPCWIFPLYIKNYFCLFWNLCPRSFIQYHLFLYCKWKAVILHSPSSYLYNIPPSIVSFPGLWVTNSSFYRSALMTPIVLLCVFAFGDTVTRTSWHFHAWVSSDGYIMFSVLT